MSGRSLTGRRLVCALVGVTIVAGNAARAEHTVLVEGVSASWCPHCAIASAEMTSIVESDTYDMLYVSIVADRNAFAAMRADELGVTSIPHYFFDGGHEEWIGSGGLPGAYTTRIESCSERSVTDIDLQVAVTWEGDALLGVTVSATNNGVTPYTGLVRAHVTETTSRLLTTSGKPFHFAMIGDYAISRIVSIPAGETRDLSSIWDGLTYGLSDITRDNITVVAGVYDDTTGLVDEAASATPEATGNAPDTPSRCQGATQAFVGREYTFTTEVTDPDEDQVTVMWDCGDDTPGVWSEPHNSGDTVEHSHTWAEPGTYEVKVKARDGSERESAWSEPLTVTVAIWGNANADDAVDISDAIYTLGYLFGGGPPPEPLWAADVNEDGQLNIGDAVFLLSYLFGG